MPYYKILGGKWGEKHEVGAIVEMDSHSAHVRLENGDIEFVSEHKEETVVENEEQVEVKRRGRPRKI